MAASPDAYHTPSSSQEPSPSREREVYLLVEMYSKMNFKHVELEDIDPTLSSTPCNSHMMWMTFSKRLQHIPHSVHSMWGTHVLQQTDHFQVNDLLKLETDEINKSWRVVQPFQIPFCKTNFCNGMVNRLAYPRKTFVESYESAN